MSFDVASFDIAHRVGDPAFRPAYLGFLETALAGETIGLPDGFRHNSRTWDYEMIMRHGGFAPGDRVLECGALHTFFCVYLAQFVAGVTATDSYYWAERSFAASLQKPADWERQIARASGGRVVGEAADMRRLPYPDASFDKVLTISAIEHVDDDRAAFAELMRVLRPGGRLIVTTEFNDAAPKPYAEADGSYHRIYDRAGLAALCAPYAPRDVAVSQTQDAIDAMARRWKFTTLFFTIDKK